MGALAKLLRRRKAEPTRDQLERRLRYAIVSLGIRVGTPELDKRLHEYSALITEGWERTEFGDAIRDLHEERMNNGRTGN